MSRGADGAMTGFGYPEMMADVVALAEAGDMDRAQDIFDAYLPLVRYEQQPGLGLAVRKYALAKRGAIASAALRKAGAGLAPDLAVERPPPGVECPLPWQPTAPRSACGQPPKKHFNGIWPQVPFLTFFMQRIRAPTSVTMDLPKGNFR